MGGNIDVVWIVFDKDEFPSSKCKPSEYDPGTTVHLLVEELRRFLDE